MTAHPAPVLAGREPDTPSSAAKVLGVLRTMLEGGRGAVGLSEIALAGGLPRSTAHRLLKELEGQGFVERSGSLYRLGADFLDLAQEAHHGSGRPVESPGSDRRQVSLDEHVVDSLGDVGGHGRSGCSCQPLQTVCRKCKKDTPIKKSRLIG